MKNKELNEELSRIKGMMKSIINEDFEMSKQTENTDPIVDCELSAQDSDTMEIVVMYDQEDKYETYFISVEFDYEDEEAQTYDYPGYGGGAIGSVNGIQMTHPEERKLTPEESKNLLSNEHVERCVSAAMEDMESKAYEDYRDSGPDPDDYYDRMRDDD
jgi:hypothetical protein